ncbi:MAG: allantoinase AllB [Cyanobacteria bacterium REEB65]|nr:allantoinase AllB [Cyanobacteria bacterium REEB65]
MQETDVSSVEFVRSLRVVIDGEEQPALLRLENGRIDAILPHDAPAANAFEAGNKPVLPAFIDTHVHVNEPGRTEWEGFDCATRAAAAGGIGTIVDMPLNCLPVTTTPEAFKAKLSASTGKLWVDCGFWGGLVPANARNLEPLLDTGVLGVKCFLIDSGIPEFPCVDESDLRAALPVLADFGLPLLVHAELPVHKSPPAGDPRKYATYLASRPPEMEVQAIRMMIRLCREFGTRIHIVHLSAAAALDDLAQARADGLPITVETCPHYLALTAEEVPDGATAFKCAPPIRGNGNRERLWQGLWEGTIDYVVCDHSPCTPALKKAEEGDFMAAWGGIASVQLAPAIVWTEASQRGFTLGHLTRWMSRGPAEFAGLTRKGKIAVGADADLVVWDEAAASTVTTAQLFHRHAVTPYLGRTLLGKAIRTYTRGTVVYGGPLIEAPPGLAILRSRRRAPLSSSRPSPF